jgi:hypothetical protein
VHYLQRVRQDIRSNVYVLFQSLAFPYLKHFNPHLYFIHENRAIKLSMKNDKLGTATGFYMKN